MCLTNAELLVGVDFTANERVNTLLQDPGYIPFALYPGPQAVNFNALKQRAAPEEKTPLVFVIDGTWRTARRILNQSRNVRALPRLSFSRSYASRFSIKRQPMAHCVSTIEAIYHLCSEAEEAGYERLHGQAEVLMELLDKLVTTQLYYVRSSGKLREESVKNGLKGIKGGLLRDALF